MTQDTLIYLHIQKAGGITFRRFLTKQYSEPGTLFDFRAPRFIKDNYQKFSKLSDEEKRALQCVMGQLTIGIHKELPQNCKYITIARHPVERIISMFYFIWGSKQHPFHAHFVETNMDFDRFLDEYSYTSTYLSRVFCPVDNIGDTLFALHNLFPEDGLTKAKENFERHINFVGLIQSYDESLVMMKERFGWANTQYMRQNVTKNKPDRDTIPSQTIKKIERHVELDMELYELILKRYEEQKRAYTGNLEQDVADFKATNAHYQSRVRLHKRLGPQAKLAKMLKGIFKKALNT